MKTQEKKWLLDNGFIIDQDEHIVAVFPDTVPIEDRKLAEIAPAAISQIRKFVDEVNNGKLKARTAVRSFEMILNKLD